MADEPATTPPAPTSTTPPPATPPPPVAPTAPAAPDLSALQKELDKAKREGASSTTTELLKTLGFDKLEDAQAFVTAKRDADAAQLTEIEKREKAAADREAAALQRESDAKKLIERGVIRNQLSTAGVPADSLDDAEGLVRIEGDVTDETAKTAVEALKAKPAFASLFAAPGTTPPAPSGYTGANPPGSPPPPVKGLEAGRELARKQREEQEKRSPMAAMHVVGKTA